MILDHKDDLKAFRGATRQWIHDTLPPGEADRLSVAKGDEMMRAQKWWMAERHKVGLATPHWPREYGGADLSLAHQIVIADEFARANAPSTDIFTISLNHIPGTLIPFGTDAQRREHLPRVAEGMVWCQGFSEPGAGSDLASLRTRAVRDGDHYVVNGQKIWSSYSMYAEWCILLTRTDPDAPRKQQGITYFLLDMKSPGVEVRPIKKSTGISLFSELFFDDVRIPVSNRVGEENQGWSVAQATLSSERGILVFEATERQRARLERYYQAALGRDAPWLQDQQLRREFMSLYGETQSLRLQIRELLQQNSGEHGGGYSIVPAVVKLVSSALRQKVADFQVRAANFGGQAVGASAEGVDDAGLFDFIDSYGYTISAGTNEIMRNLIAERGLNLPR